MAVIFRSGLQTAVVIAVFLLQTQVGCVAESILLGRLSNALGGADRQGHCSVWWSFDGDIKLSDKVELPLRACFSSAPRFADSCLGQGWWLPLLEGSVVRQAERAVLVNTPGGGLLAMASDAQNPEEFSTPDQRYKGRETGQGRFEIKGSDGWMLRFHKGRLTTMETPGGEVLTWEYADSRVTRVDSNRNGELMTMTYDPKTTLLTSLRVVKTGRKYAFNFGQLPMIAKLGDLNAVTGVAPTLNSISLGGLRLAAFHFEPSDKLDELRLSIEQLNKPADQQKEGYAWEPVSGIIRKDPKGTFEVLPPKEPNGFASVARVSSKGGSRESYTYDIHTGVADFVGPDGLRRRRTYNLAPGAAHGKTRKTEVFDEATKSFKTLYQASFDKDGKLLRATQDGETQSWTYKPGEVDVYKQAADGQQKNLQYTRKLGNDGETLSTVFSDGVKIEYVKDSNGKDQAIVSKDGVSIKVDINKSTE